MIINTVLSLLGSAVSTFITSAWMNNKKFRMEDILNATLAGGVIIGTSCDMIRNPFVAMLIGLAGGVISTYGFNRLTPWLNDKGYLHDTCGVINLHGIPGFVGAILGSINAAVADSGSFAPVNISDVFPKRAFGPHPRS